MLNILWIILILFILFFSIKVSKTINYDNFNFKKIFKSFKGESKLGLFLTLGTKIGVGSIIGTAASIFIGGPGSIFWMLIFSFISSSLIYLEVVVANKYKEKIDNIYVSGPYYIIKNAFDKKSFALAVGLILVICYSFLFLMVQTNTINNIINFNINISKYIIILFLGIILFLSLIFNLKELLNVTSYIVPFMCLLFIILALFIVLSNISVLPKILKSIIFEAFNIKSFLVGLLIGIKRSVFLNELLIGTTSSTSIVKSNDLKKCALQGVFGSYFITFVVGFLNSLLILLYINNNSIYNINSYNELINNVFKYHLGNIGTFFLIIILLLFGITTIISGIYIGVSNIKNMFKSKYSIFIFKLFVVLFSYVGLFININVMWNIIDIFLLILLIINSITLYKIIGDKYDWKRLG